MVLVVGKNSHLLAGSIVPKSGFETTLAIPDAARYVAVEALDDKGHVLRVSETVRRG